jgi:glycosyltransferase involved in cell wall biosynthesis
MTPLFSVIIPAFNGARYLPEAIDSVRAQHDSIELIVVDDGSTDDTVTVVRALGPGITLLQQAHAGIGSARNLGVAHARGTFLGFLDADDLFTPNKLTLQAAHLQREGGPDLSFGAVEEFVSGELADEQKARLHARGTLQGAVAGAMLMRRSAFSRVGPFAAWRVGEFVDWYMRAMEAGLRAETLPDVVLRRRLHGDNVGIRARDARVDYARIMKGALDRRRQGRS